MKPRVCSGVLLIGVCLLLPACASIDESEVTGLDQETYEQALFLRDRCVIQNPRAELTFGVIFASNRSDNYLRPIDQFPIVEDHVEDGCGILGLPFRGRGVNLPKPGEPDPLARDADGELLHPPTGPIRDGLDDANLKAEIVDDLVDTERASVIIGMEGSTPTAVAAPYAANPETEGGRNTPFLAVIASADSVTESAGAFRLRNSAGGWGSVLAAHVNATSTSDTTAAVLIDSPTFGGDVARAFESAFQGSICESVALPPTSWADLVADIVANCPDLDLITGTNRVERLPEFVEAWAANQSRPAGVRLVFASTLQDSYRDPQGNPLVSDAAREVLEQQTQFIAGSWDATSDGYLRWEALNGGQPPASQFELGAFDAAMVAALGMDYAGWRLGSRDGSAISTGIRAVANNDTGHDVPIQPDQYWLGRAAILLGFEVDYRGANDIRGTNGVEFDERGELENVLYDLLRFDFSAPETTPIVCSISLGQPVCP